MIDVNKYIEDYKTLMDNIETIKLRGKVTDVVGLIVVSQGPSAVLGEICSIYNKYGEKLCDVEVVGFKDGKVLSIALDETGSISPSCEIVATGKSFRVGVGDHLLGRVIDALGNPIDGKGEIIYSQFRNSKREPPNPMERQRIVEPLQTGVRSIDGLLTIGKGQRIGIFAGAGLGKSVLLGMIARNTNADVNVISLVGERGREVREFIEKELKEEGLKRSVVVVATSDKSALLRLKGAYTAITIAEYFRDQGKDVNLMMDSTTRFAQAQREIGLTIGEPPATKGYTPSVFSLLPKILERAGTAKKGSITGFFTVLVEGDDMTEPVADAVKAILDGHIVLSRKLANKGIFPAIDPLQSVSRIMPDIVDEKHRRKAMEFINILSTYRDSEDLINIGAYVKGSNPNIDYALAKYDSLINYIRQDIMERTTLKEAIDSLYKLIDKV